MYDHVVQETFGSMPHAATDWRFGFRSGISCGGVQLSRGRQIWWT